jgi:CheY-like chemotaxis protein
MDLYMPEMNGLEAVKHIRQMREYHSMPIIALTANSSKRDHKDYLEAGMNAVLTKPIDEKQIKDTLAAWIDLKGMHEIKGVDTDKALQQMGDKLHVLQFALTKFSLEYSEYERKIQAYLRQEQKHDALRSTHSLKGAAAHLHAVNLLQSVRHLESLLLSNSSSEEELSSILQQVQQEINHITESLPW